MDWNPRTAEVGWARAFWTSADAIRQRQGELLDQLGWGPETSPSRLVQRWHPVELLAFHDAEATGPTVLIVPAPIKTWHIWDLAPDRSVVRRCLREGLRVYLVGWHKPEAGDEALGLEQYADELLLNCLHAIADETGQARVFLVGHSLGGTLAAIFTSLHREPVRGLVEIQGPMEFDPEAGGLEAALMRSPLTRAITDRLGNVPGSLLSLTSLWADPLTFMGEPLLGWLESLPFPRAIRSYLQTRRWTLDETPMPRRLFEEVVEQLYRENRFALGVLEVGGRRADPRTITAPIVAVIDPRSHIVPPASIEAYRTRTASPDVSLLPYGGDMGVMLQHVGALIGDDAHRTLWPRILHWVHDHSALDPRHDGCG
jgi:polyhydroxyalkanoate synthase